MTLEYSSDLAFTPAVKAIQRQKGSREAYSRMEQNGGWRTAISDDWTAFIGEPNSFYLASAIVVTVEAWDVSCAKHIVLRYADDQIVDLVGGLRTRIRELEAALAALKADQA